MKMRGRRRVKLLRGNGQAHTNCPCCDSPVMDRAAERREAQREIEDER